VTTTLTPPSAPDLSRRRRPGEAVVHGVLLGCAGLTILITLGIVGVLITDTVRFFRIESVTDFLFGTEFAPGGGLLERGRYGLLPLLCGTLLVTAIALVIAVPLGLGGAIYLSEYAPRRVRAIVKPTLELLAGVPTVVLGFFGLKFVTPSILKALFGGPGGQGVDVFNAAAAGICVGLAVIPLIASVSEDALRAVPSALREASYAMGASKRVTAVRVVVPAALSGISAAVILGMSRAIGETMIVTLAGGASPKITADPFTSIQTMTAAIAQTFTGEASAGSPDFLAVYAIGSVLFAITLGFNLLSNGLVRRFRQEY
jgi:phosphate transport system permease protein